MNKKKLSLLITAFSACTVGALVLANGMANSFNYARADEPGMNRSLSFDWNSNSDTSTAGNVFTVECDGFTSHFCDDGYLLEWTDEGDTIYFNENGDLALFEQFEAIHVTYLEEWATEDYPMQMEFYDENNIYIGTVDLPETYDEYTWNFTVSEMVGLASYDRVYFQFVTYGSMCISSIVIDYYC